MRSLLSAIGLAALVCFGAPGPAAAQPAPAPKDEDVKKAEKYANDAYAAYEKKDYASAVALYVKAIELSPSADMVYNIAKIYDTKLGDRTLAMNFYRRYISEPGADPDRVREANERIAALKAAEQAAAEKPEAPAAGDKPQKTAAEKSGPEPIAAPPEESGMTGLQTTGLVLGGIGIVGLGVGAYFGLGAMKDNNTAKDHCDGNACTDQAGVDAAKDASSKATISTIGFGAGGALLATGVVLLLVGGKSTKERPPSVAGLSLTPSAGPRAMGLTLDGRW
jgi:tetratricopeptide (TPR) repeat protein